MKNKILLAIAIILAFVLAFISITVKKVYFEPLPIKEGEKVTYIRLLNEEDGSITTLNIEDYIIGVVSAEMPSSFELEALKAQAVAARTFAMYKKETRNLDYDVIIGTKDQAYQSNEQLLRKWGPLFFTNYLKVREAVTSTTGEIITFEDKTINAFYFSMSNGYTEKSSLVFKQDLPYLNSVESSWDNESINNYIYTKSIPKNEFCEKLKISCETIIIEDISRSDTNRLLTIKINGKEFKGTDLRAVLGLRSTDMEISIKEEKVEITTKGYGHGVGMSQYGANGMAKEGYDYKSILSHYYQNTKIAKINA